MKGSSTIVILGSFRFAWVSLIALCLTYVVLGQTETATISGLVMDPSGAPVPQALVVLESLEHGIKTQVMTNDGGLYAFPAVQPGHYQIMVRKEGFKQVDLLGVIVNVQDHIQQNFGLQIGSVSESVTVEGRTPLIRMQDASVGTVVDRQFVENIPLNGRSFQSLILLTPGVAVIPAPGTTNTIGQFSINGQRASANSFMVDGVSANFGASAGSFGGPQSSGNLPGFTVLGSTQSLASVDAVQEFKVQTSTYAAEYGRQAGGQISIVTRSGTNQFHGSAFDYLRNNIFDANDWFANRLGQPRPPERQNDFGGTFGGPVVIPGLYNGRNRTFFFFSEEALRLRLPLFGLTNVPSLALRQQAPAGMQPILNGFPLPNGKELGNGLAEFSAGYSDPSSVDATSIRIDHTVNSKLTLFARYNRAPSETSSKLSNNLSAFLSGRLSAQSVTAGATASLTPRAGNELKMNFSDNSAHRIFGMNNFGGATPPPRTALIPSQYDSESILGTVRLNFPGMTSTTPPQVELSGNNVVTGQRQFNIVDNFSYTVGSHQFKFGVDYRRLTPTASLFPYSLTTTFLSQQRVLAASADNGSLSVNLTVRPVFLNFSAYVDDTWKLSRRLTLSLGLRWDVNPAPSEASGNNQVAVTEITNIAAMRLAPKGTQVWKTTYNNFAPRLGVAYQVSQAPGRETVVRGGFGVFYDAGNDYSATNFTSGFPFSATVFLTNIAYPLSPTQVAPPPIPIQAGLTPPYGSFFAFDPALKLPYTLQWNVAVEQSLGRSQAFTVSYVGAASRRLLQDTLLTLTPINPSFTTIQLIRNISSSDYDALQAQFQRRLSRGLQALISYTWSHALDDDSTSSTFRVAQRGNAAFDVRHVFVAAATYDVPTPINTAVARAILGHWSMDTSFHSQSGLPVDLAGATFTNPADGSLNNVRPNLNLGVPVYIDDPTVPGGRKINKAAFSNPPVGVSGNFGRNQVRGLGAWQQDFALRREIPLHERLRLQLRAEAFNVFNHPNFGTIQTTLTAANFGQPTNMLNRQLGGISQLYQIGGPRSLQFALKLQF